MITNKYLIIFIILFLMIISLSLLNYLFKDNINSKTRANNFQKNINEDFINEEFINEEFSNEDFINEEFTNNNIIDNKREDNKREDNKREDNKREDNKREDNKREDNRREDNKRTDNKNEYNNLIVNGNFEDGKNILNHTTQSGYNRIIMMKNPGLSSYVLEQRKTDNLTYYELICDNEKNSKYNLYFWLSIKNNNIEELNLDKLIKIKIQNDDYSNYIPRLDYNIIQKVILSNDNENTWYLLKYNFISSNTTKDKMQIYLNYDINLQMDNYYFTSISLYRVLIDAENFIYNSNLLSYVDGYHYESNTTTFHDLSGRGNDLFWSNIPTADYTKGSLRMLSSKLVGFSCDKLSNKNFTIILCINKNFQNPEMDHIEVSEETYSIDDLYLLSLPGNERYSLEIKFKDNYIYLINGNKEYRSKSEIILYNKSLLAITYENDIINIYQDGIKILSETINKIYFSSNNLIINRNKNLDYNLYSLLFYNRVIDRKELDDIRTYFITNKDQNFNTPDINIHHMNNNMSNTSTDLNNGLFKPFNNKMSNNASLNNNTFIDTFDNQNYKIKEIHNTITYRNLKDTKCAEEDELCVNDCTTLCEKFFNCNNSVKYDQCISNCKNVLPSCQEFCDNDNNKSNIYCNPSKDTNECPIVYKKNGNFMVYIKPNTKYAKELNFSGERSYGKNIKKARYTYNINFPNCPTPFELTDIAGKSYIETCPYVINEANPCHMSVCHGVNWNVTDYNDLKLNKKCKKVVSNYCQLNYDIDEKCSCWGPSNKNDKRCIDFRRHFEDPNDYCSANQFKIEEHPDFSKYIKKDNIPCWGCNLNA